MESYDASELRKVLLEADVEAQADGCPPSDEKLIIVGGSAFILKGLTSRAVTKDLDLVEYPDGIRSVLARYTNVINSSATVYYDALPYNFEDRLEPLAIETRTFRAFTPSLEDLVVMKLYGRRDNDMADITSPEVLDSLDWELLDKLVKDPLEASASALSYDQYRWMVMAYEEYRQNYGPRRRATDGIRGLPEGLRGQAEPDGRGKPRRSRGRRL